MSDKKKKKKTVYVDDGRTIADMSSLYGKRADNGSGANSRPTQPKGLFDFTPGNTPKDWARTYLNTVKTMLLPMLATIGVISCAFLVLWIILELAS